MYMGTNTKSVKQIFNTFNQVYTPRFVVNDVDRVVAVQEVYDDLIASHFWQYILKTAQLEIDENGDIPLPEDFGRLPQSDNCDEKKPLYFPDYFSTYTLTIISEDNRAEYDYDQNIEPLQTFYVVNTIEGKLEYVSGTKHSGKSVRFQYHRNTEKLADVESIPKLIPKGYHWVLVFGLYQVYATSSDLQNEDTGSFNELREKYKMWVQNLLSYDNNYIR